MQCLDSGSAVAARTLLRSSALVAVSFIVSSAHARGLTTESCAAVANASAIHPFFERAAVARVDVVGIGDSNHAYAGHGWDEGWQRALAERYRAYASPLFSMGENAGNGSGLGWLVQAHSINPTGVLTWSGAPAALNPLLPPGILVLNYAYLAEGSFGAATNTAGVYMQATSPIDVSAALRFRIVSGVFAGAGAGSFQPFVRMGQPPWSWLVTGSAVSTRGPTWGTRVDWIDLPAAARTTALDFRVTPWGQAVVGPFLGYYQRVENLQRSTGASFSTLQAWGGQSARDMAEALQTMPDAMLDLYFSEIRALQGPQKSVLIRINTGLNDRNETLPSRGPAAIKEGPSAAAFVDNLRALILRITGTWQRNGWPTDELFFLLSVSHPVSDPEDKQLVSYREAAVVLCAEFPRTAVTRFDRLTDHAEMLASGWYQAGGTDVNHLTANAFHELARREIDAARPKPCQGDADGDGAVNFSDVTTVLANFGDCDPRGTAGDASDDAVVSFVDITVILSRFGSSCP